MAPLPAPGDDVGIPELVGADRLLIAGMKDRNRALHGYVNIAHARAGRLLAGQRWVNCWPAARVLVSLGHWRHSAIVTVVVARKLTVSCSPIALDHVHIVFLPACLCGD
jgi:hypothetical protein